MLAILLITAMAIMVAYGVNPLELKLKAGLQVTTDNVPASLFLNDQYLDKTPFIDKKIQPNIYSLRIDPDDTSLADYELPVTLHKGTVTVVTWKPGPTLETSGGVVYEMERLRQRGESQVEFQTIPDGAILTIDNGAKQFSPVLLTDLAEGNHQFEVSLPSYETQQHTVNLVKGHKITLTVILGKISDTVAPEPTATVSGTPADETALRKTFTTPQVQILSTNFFSNDQEVLRVRVTPTPLGEEIGFAPVGSFYPYLGETEGWLNIEFAGQAGWVSAQYSQKIEASGAQTAQ
ncbi:MAG: PEGA domain protein [Candidatus Pacebacteria bacterium GW2011_GWB1_47_8]|nr:MAG: PEGA domain protein [Candidatus Pacebacteria bacterium GW2011_GWA1_46_10]KKU84583.1 MAG: PEGA domain protein [Candidatus Pacebacteria bacterium GW2011_GWB1_47_8]